MNRGRMREVKAEIEPEDPVETTVCDVERLGPEEATKAFDPYGGRDADIRDRKFKRQLEAGVEDGHWIVFRFTYRTYTPPLWQRDHYTGGHGSESAKHKRFKIVAAEFLDQCGHQMPHVENPAHNGVSNHTPEWVYPGECFEVGYTPGVADVACRSDECNTYAEVGYVSAEKWFQAIDSNVQTLVVIPYDLVESHGRKGCDYNVYVFHRSSVFEG